MYSCVRALIRQRGDNQRLMESIVNDVPVRELMENYAVVYLILTHTAIEHEVSLKLDDVTTLVYGLSPNTTVDQWMVALGVNSLPTSDDIPQPSAGVAKYNDAWAAGYELELRHRTAGAGIDYPDFEKRDILMTRQLTDYSKFFENCVVTVNGLFHITDYTEDGIIVKEGGRTVYRANQNNIGIISFADVGKLKFIPITAEMLTPRATGLASGVIVTLPEDIGNRIPVPVIGGFPHFQNQYYRIVGDRNILIDWSKIPILHRYHRTRQVIEMESLHATMTMNKNHPGMIDVNQMNTDAAITAYLTLSQSFIILVEADNLYIERHALERTGLPGRYYAYERPIYPLQLDTGLMPAYAAMPKANMFTICTEPAYHERFVHDTHPIDDDRYHGDALISSKQKYYPSAYLLEIGTDRIAT